ncbi:MAG TPA: amidase [Terriglobales bacterium]|nr:amidase [Terriglobales bacterium]
MLNDETLYLTVEELGEQLRTRKISAVELTESYLARSERLGPRLHAYATLTRELALKEAHAAEQEIAAGKYRGPLHGMPYAAKDLLAVRGYPTTWGAAPYAEQQFDYDATVIQKLRHAGAILIGKAAMIELAGGMGYRFASASHTGAARNPWNEACWTCGSSSGSAAIVSSAMAAFAIGSETWGSIVCPSAFTGISGLRPTYGRVSRHGAMSLAYSMDKLGPMARSAHDCGIILAAIAGHDPLDPASLPAQPTIFNSSSAHAPAQASRVRTAKKTLRVGWLTNAWKDLSPGVEKRIQEAQKVVRGFAANFAEATLPEGPWEAAAGLVISAECASAFDKLIESGGVAKLADPEGRLGGYINQQIAATDLVRANRLRRVLQHKMAELFGQFDVLATASLPVTASKLEANLDDELSFPDPLGGIGNFCGLPAISVPCGLADDQLPVGLQFVAPPLGETAVLQAAQEFQHTTRWHKLRPNV